MFFSGGRRETSLNLEQSSRKDRRAILLLVLGGGSQIHLVGDSLDSPLYKTLKLRTLQRHVKVWKALYGPARETFFTQIYYPGQWCCSDFTCMNKLDITINNQPFKHLFYHFVLCYSNWQTGQICYSESFESLNRGLQDALWQLGGVPRYHRTDNLTSAVHKVGHPDVFTDNYSALAKHYGFTSEKTQVSRPNENGDVEKSHDIFKKAVDQALLLRGSRDFDSIKAYEKFLQKLEVQKPI